MKFRMMFLALVFMSLLGSCFAEVMVSEIACESGTQLVLENSLVRMVVSPATGGRILSYQVKDKNKEWIDDKVHGLFLDHVTQQTWPGELMDRKYDYKFAVKNSDEVELILWTTIVGAGQGGKLEKSISGLKYIKKYTLEKGSAYLDVVVRFENPTSELKRPSLWIQNICAAEASTGTYYSYRPTSVGPLEGILTSHTAKDEKIEFRFDPTAGWSATTDPSMNQGLVFFMDYDYLKCLYCCKSAMTTEWWFYPVAIMPGKSFETHAGVWPMSGMKAVSYASMSMVSNLEVKRNGKAIDVLLSYEQGPKPKLIDKIRVSLLTYPDLDEIGFKEIAVGKVLGNTDSLKLSVDGVDEKTNLLARVVVSSKDGDEKFERYSAGVAILYAETIYTVSRPLQNRPFEKPDKIVKFKNDKPRIFHIRGLFQEYYRWNDVAECLGGEISCSDYSLSIYGDVLSAFPVSYDELMRYDLIVVDHVPWDVFTSEMVEYLSDFVLHGGELVVIGGPFNKYQPEKIAKKFLDLLPIEPTAGNRVVKSSKPLLLDGDDVKAGSFEYIYPIASVKADAKVLLSAGENPVLVSWRKGDGGVSFFTPLVLGESKAESFWKSKEYPQWMAKKINCLLQR